MTADEVFKELGYENKGILEGTFLIYYKEINQMEISFDLSEKTFVKVSRFLGVFVSINMQELKAINQKCKELGWLE